MFASIEEDARYDTYGRDFLWLVNAGVAHMLRQATEAKSPLRRTEVAGRFKLYQSDTGMLLSRYPQATARRRVSHSQRHRLVAQQRLARRPRALRTDLHDLLPRRAHGEGRGRLHLRPRRPAVTGKHPFVAVRSFWAYATAFTSQTKAMQTAVSAITKPDGRASPRPSATHGLRRPNGACGTQHVTCTGRAT